MTCYGGENAIDYLCEQGESSNFTPNPIYLFLDENNTPEYQL